MRKHAVVYPDCDLSETSPEDIEVSAMLFEGAGEHPNLNTDPQRECSYGLHDPITAEYTSEGQSQAEVRNRDPADLSQIVGPVIR